MSFGCVRVKAGWTRASSPYCMSDEEFKLTLTAIEIIAIYSRRFLPWFHLKWEADSSTCKRIGLKDLVVVRPKYVLTNYVPGGRHEPDFQVDPASGKRGRFKGGRACW
ncbi:hypothetical protein SADUNF_Sadunf05G0036500 [Salix dunnii]|uniref:Uncharacterized protein n=1 Tax=Salix dunnii TaxID=1413687 RepID=A0A835K6V5_9ROSI|nr:hypothetical protein SADUNF_Sadunf05G0036500 [Salix dunnii]